MRNLTLLLGTLLCLGLKAEGQDTIPSLENYTPVDEIYLSNPSFEGFARCCTAPEGWTSCSPKEETPPDVQPGWFQVNLPAADGDTYLGMVVRDNNTCESVSQELPDPLRAGEVYLLEAFLARAKLYLSLSRTTGEEVNYATPVKLRVWGGNGDCLKQELLGESALITGTAWQQHQIMLAPGRDYRFIFLEAYYKTPVLFPYNGNILVDKVSLNLLSRKN